jgi:hypothetical protein
MTILLVEDTRMAAVRFTIPDYAPDWLQRWPFFLSA